MSVDPIKVIAHGGQPEWEHTFEHPEHGEIIFKAKLPTAAMLMKQSVAMDNLLAELSPDADPRAATLIMATSISGIQHIIEPAVVAEERIEQDEHITVHQTFYDPMSEQDTAFLVEVWGAFWVWRQQQLERVDELKLIRGDEWQRIKRVVHRHYGLPFNDPRLADWTEADYLREFAFLELEREGQIEEPFPEDEWEELEQAAEEGRWEDIGLDPPDDFQAATFDEFMKHAEAEANAN